MRTRIAKYRMMKENSKSHGGGVGRGGRRGWVQSEGQEVKDVHAGTGTENAPRMHGVFSSVNLDGSTGGASPPVGSNLKLDSKISGGWNLLKHFDGLTKFVVCSMGLPVIVKIIQAGFENAGRGLRKQTSKHDLRHVMMIFIRAAVGRRLLKE